MSYRMPWETRVEMLCEELLAAENWVEFYTKELIDSFKGKNWPSALEIKYLCNKIAGAEEVEWQKRYAYYKLYFDDEESGILY